MGGLEALSLGLTQPETFRYVVGMSSAVHGEKFDEHFPSMAAGYAASRAQFKLLWVGCGTDDGLIKANRDFVAWAKGQGHAGDRGGDAGAAHVAGMATKSDYGGTAAVSLVVGWTRAYGGHKESDAGYFSVPDVQRKLP